MFGKLDGVGKKSAARYAYCVLNFTEEEAAAFASAVLAAKTEIKKCSVCCNITTHDVCTVCSSESRDHSTVCVVEDPRAMMAIEKTRQFNGVYHILHGTISPMRGITPDKLTIHALLNRIRSEEEPIEELILATNPTVEGEATAMYISRLVKPSGVRTTRIAHGLPVGGDLEYADEVTLSKALEGRREL